MTNLSESIIGKIKSENIQPVPRWHFLLKNYVFWSFFVVSVLLGSFSFSVIMHIANSGDFDLLDHLKGNIFTSSIMLLPYFWILFSILFAVVGYVNWKHTKKGYRLKRRWIFLGSIVLSFLFGALFYTIGLGRFVDLLMVEKLPFYSQSKHRARIDLWQQPQKGLIIGRILDLNKENNTFVIEDGNGNRWNIGDDVQNKNKEQLSLIIQKGAIVKIIGFDDGSNCFVAKDIRSCSDCDGDNDDYGGLDSDQDGQ